VFNNQSGALVNLTTDGDFQSTGTITINPMFHNLAGATYRKSGGSGTSGFYGSLNFDNAGDVDLLSGDSYFPQGLTQTAGNFKLMGGSASGAGTATDFNFNGGTLSTNGNATINNATVRNNLATFNLGGTGAAGTLNLVASNYVQGSGGTINFEIGGTGTSQYDRLIVGGTVNLNGTANFSLISSFTPVSGNTFDILTWSGTRTGDFSSYSGLSGLGMTSAINDSSTPRRIRVTKS
jgi:hypothetical protein